MFRELISYRESADFGEEGEAFCQLAALETAAPAAQHSQ